jgi:hypothetical protein
MTEQEDIAEAIDNALGNLLGTMTTTGNIQPMQMR